MLIAVPLTDKNFEEDAKAIKDLGADAVEVRVDLFEDKSSRKGPLVSAKGKVLRSFDHSDHKEPAGGWQRGAKQEGAL